MWERVRGGLGLAQMRLSVWNRWVRWLEALEVVARQRSEAETPRDDMLMGRGG